MRLRMHADPCKPSLPSLAITCQLGLGYTDSICLMKAGCHVYRCPCPLHSLTPAVYIGSKHVEPRMGTGTPTPALLENPCKEWSDCTASLVHRLVICLCSFRCSKSITVGRERCTAGSSKHCRTMGVKDPFVQSNRASRPWLLDGGFATELERRGQDLSRVTRSSLQLSDLPAILTGVYGCKPTSSISMYRITSGAPACSSTTLSPYRPLI